MEAVARINVTFYVDADTLYAAEKALETMLRRVEDDDALRAYLLRGSDSEWVPECYVPAVDE